MSATGGLHAQGKVRDIYEAGPDALLLVATDRLSAFDVILPNPIPDKGRVLTAFSLFWFERTKDLVGNHLLTANRWEFPGPFGEETFLSGRATLVKRAEVVPIECVARGYLSGSGWREYRGRGSVCGVELPGGSSSRTASPSRSSRPRRRRPRATTCPVTLDETADLIGRGLAEKLKELTLAIYERIASVALERGVIVADTKFEFGFCEGELILIDEVGTPDSSRFWPADRYVPGGPQPSFDKQFVRDWLDMSGWDHEPPPPELPAEVIARTALKYREAYERVTGEKWDWYLQRMGALDEKDWETCAINLDRLRKEHG